MGGKVVISKCAAVTYVCVTIAVIVAVGLLVGLVGRSDNKDVIVVDTTTPVSITTVAPTSTPPGPWTSIRLPSTLVPYHYSVDLQPDLEPDAGGMYWFTGNSSVSFTVAEATSFIYIHSNKLEYESISLIGENGQSANVKNYELYEPYQYLVIETSAMLVEGTNYTLTTAFKGELADDLGGLYRSVYTNKAGESVVIATTQMQPTDARKAFPCFDEPALKATFDISLWHKDPNYALSNMPTISTEVVSGDWKRTTFERTPMMSSYLLAFVVCDFEYVNGSTSDGVQTRIYAREQQVEEGNANYARNITPNILEYFGGYFNVSYPLPKSDQIAVADFAAGAMENWGLVIYRETALLYNPLVNSASNQQRVAAVVAHELAHQWFGNLISPLWWDELWLNEGFASYVEYLGTDHVEPTWGMMEQFVVNDLHQAMSVDALTSSRPIVQEVSTPAEINSLFDTISYQKGACIIRMINRFAGERAFTLGLERYLKANAYGSVTHQELFLFWENAIDETAGAENPPTGFSDAMSTWTLQMGYPVITMQRRASDRTKINVTQERFLADPTADSSLPESPFNYKWDVPLWYKKGNETNATLEWMTRDQTSMSFDSIETEYFIGNYEAYGYYRVNYDDENWLRIIDQLNNNFLVIEVKSRGQLIDDAFNLAKTGRVSYDIAFRSTEFLRQDFEYVPWESALDVMSYFDRVLGRSGTYGVYSSYLLYLVQPLYDQLKWTDSGDHLDQYQRINAIGVACGYGNESCIQEAASQFDMWRMSDNNTITANLRSTVYCNAIGNGNDVEWDFAWEKYQTESNSQEKAKLQYGLSCTRKPWIIRRFLDFVLNDTYVRKQDASAILEDLCYNEYARDITWDYVRQEWDFIYNVYGTGFFSFSGIISSCTSHFSTEFELQELETFKSDNSDKLGSGLRSVEQAIEETRANIDWRTNHEDEVFTWLDTFKTTNIDV